LRVAKVAANSTTPRPSTKVSANGGGRNLRGESTLCAFEPEKTRFFGVAALIAAATMVSHSQFYCQP
ncbi:MAG TPA: hypothetical protein DIU09_03525, partial [Hyphomonadaceae bacterium]|nr:hypothetical protein [Hyphomonadaceae bacterium]